MSMAKAILITAMAIVSGGAGQQNPPFKPVFQWNFINVSWPSESVRANTKYIPENNAIAGIKVWKEKIYLTVPRWKDGVPVTLGVISARHHTGNDAPNLEAYPNWEMQTVGACSAFQFVQSMEIDPAGRMWVLDTGRTETSSLKPNNRCPPRLVILDLENNGEILRSYAFPEDVASPTSAHLNDIVLDHNDGGFAYITDSSQSDPGIIVFSLRDRASWKVRDDSMKANEEDRSFKAGEESVVDLSVPVDGIALSPAKIPNEDRLVYYSPLSSYHLYTLRTRVLKNRTLDVREHVRDLGRKLWLTDGMMMSMSGQLFFGSLNDDAVYYWDTNRHGSFSTECKMHTRNHTTLRWPDTFSFDSEGNLWCVSNSLQNFIKNKVNVAGPNYRVMRVHQGDRSYQYLADGSAPKLPAIPAGADALSLALVTLFAAFLAYLVQ